jgi:tetratricopeptide (TPR) repeat protein
MRDDEQVADDVTRRLDANDGPGLVVNFYERTPRQRSLVLLMNQYEQAADPAERATLGTAIENERRALHDARGDGHSNPPWLALNIDGLVESTFGRHDRALALHRQSLQYAATDQQRAVSLGNIADALREFGRARESLPVLLQAVDADPRNVVAWGDLALVLFELGEEAAALEILGRVPAEALRTENSAWRLHLINYEDRIRGWSHAALIDQIYDIIWSGE